MTTSKFYSIVMSACCLLAMGNKPSCATIPDIDNVISKVSEGYPNYLHNKDYNYILDADLKKQVARMCGSTSPLCGKNTCYKNLATQAKCRELCPENDLHSSCISEDIDKVLSEVSEGHTEYLSSRDKYPVKDDRNYDGILDDKLKKKVREICKKDCTRFSCVTDSEGPNKMKVQCRKLCPTADIIHCLNSVYVDY